MRIAIVNDLSESVDILRRIVHSVAEYEIAWIAYNGEDAVNKCALDVPDLILMNLSMPVMDGVEATRRIMKESPCAILIVTSMLENKRAKVFTAMGYGALDVSSTPVVNAAGVDEDSDSLLEKIGTIAKLLGKTPGKYRHAANRHVISQKPNTVTVPLVLIGSSTGGPKALAAVLSHLTGDFKAAVGIIQHVDAAYAPGLAEWLDTQTQLSVSLVEEGARFKAGRVLIAGTNDHLIMNPDLTLSYTVEPRDYVYRPSVDIFFKSVAKYWPVAAAAVLLTGMGSDGAEGLKALRDNGWYTITQDRQTSIVYGMPKAAVTINAAMDILPLNKIAPALVSFISENAGNTSRRRVDT